jgi:PAT family beta-lactamase induction signal transducer AmpG
MGTAALLAFMATLTNRRFTATQFAMLSTLATMPRALLSAPSGYMAEALGWPQFFIASALIAIPGLVLLLSLRDLFEDGAGRAPGRAGDVTVTDTS